MPEQEHARSAPGTELSCRACGGLFSPARKRLLLGGLSCPYCGNEQPVDPLIGPGSLAASGADGAGPPTFELGKEAEPWRVDRDWFFGGLFAVGQAVVILGMMLAVLFRGSPAQDLLVNGCVILGVLAFAGAFGARVLPERWLRSVFTRRPRLRVDRGSLRLRTRSGRVRLALGQLQAVTPLDIFKLDLPTRTMLLGGAESCPAEWIASRPHTLVLHLGSGMAVALPLLLTPEQAGDVAGRLNRHLLEQPEQTDGQGFMDELPAGVAAPGPHDRLRPGYTTGGLQLPAPAPPRTVSCPHCGAQAELPPQIQIGDSVTCAYCDGIVVLRFMEESVLLGRVRLAATARLLRQGDRLQMEQRRLGFRSLPAADGRGTFAVWSIFAVALGSVPVAMVLSQPAWVWLPVTLAHLFPLAYLSRSTAVRGDRDDGLLTASKIFAGIGSLGLWLLPVLIYRSTGRLNPYRLGMDGTRLQEGFRFGRRRQLELARVRRAMVFQWDRLEIVAEPGGYVDRVRELEQPGREKAWLRSIYDDEKLESRAIWGMACELDDGQVYLSQVLSDRSGAELLALHVNRVARRGAADAA